METHGQQVEQEVRAANAGGGSGGTAGKHEMIYLAPNKPLELALHWLTWKVQSPRTENLSSQIISAARKILK